MKFKELVKAQGKPITMRHEQWLSHSSNPEYSQKALDFAAKVLAQDIGGNRRRETNFRASSIGVCSRRQVFAVRGYKTRPVESDLANIFATGNFLHLKWQMAGLTEGWLIDAEVPVKSNEYSMGGTMDGIIYDGSLFEYKSINPKGFKSVCEFGPRHDHILQAHGYMWLGDLPAVSFIYEDKGSGEWREFRMERDDLIVEAIIGLTSDMEDHIAAHTLPEPLSKCIDREGPIYRNCPFRDICLEIK